MSFSDYKAKAAIVAAALTALSAFIGVLPGMMGIALAACCLGLAHAFQDIADHGLTAEGLKNDLEELKKDAALLRNQAPPEPPATIKFPGVPLLLFGLFLFGSAAVAQDRPQVPTSMQLQPDTRAWFKNPDGSCVQCSIGMAGVHCNDLNAASLLWDTAYGPAIRGGSWPSRVEAYCDKRGIKAWSVTGNTVEDTMPWIVWAAKTGRFAAIGAGTSHFQTLYGYEPGADRPWLVCNNNSTQRIDRYTDREFRQLHAASGPWVVILEKPSSEPPSFVQWWK